MKWRRGFQSPSLRGSGRFPHSPHGGGGKEDRFQSPSLRGSGRFAEQANYLEALAEQRFNPLHCGAVVASPPPGVLSILGASFNPLHCGAVVASLGICHYLPGYHTLVSIPFIAGQWSLPAARRGAARRRKWSFNPLHCGAVVASLVIQKNCFNPLSYSCFNPLHCGAVVASRHWRDCS